MGEEQEVARRGLEFVAVAGIARPALRREAGEQICLFSNSTQGAKSPLVDLFQVGFGVDRWETILQKDLPVEIIMLKTHCQLM